MGRGVGGMWGGGSNSWRSNGLLGGGGRREAEDVVTGQQEAQSLKCREFPAYFCRVTRPTTSHAYDFCLRVNDAVTR